MFDCFLICDVKVICAETWICAQKAVIVNLETCTKNVLSKCFSFSPSNKLQLLSLKLVLTLKVFASLHHHFLIKHSLKVTLTLKVFATFQILSKVKIEHYFKMTLTFKVFPHPIS